MSKTEAYLEASKIPKMHHEPISEYLYSLGGRLKDGDVVVECGSWLGASLGYVIAGAKDAGVRPVFHSYDQFRSTESEVGKAAKEGVNLEKFEDTSPRVVAYWKAIDPEVNVTAHRGKLKDAVYDGPPIRLYLDDASKRKDSFQHALRNWGPHWAVDSTIMLMDYWYFRRWEGTDNEIDMRAQHEFVQAHPENFEEEVSFWPDCEISFFYRKVIPNLDQVTL